VLLLVRVLLFRQDSTWRFVALDAPHQLGVVMVRLMHYTQLQSMWPKMSLHTVVQRRLIYLLRLY